MGYLASGIFIDVLIAKDGIRPPKLAYNAWANQAAEEIDKLN